MRIDVIDSYEEFKNLQVNWDSLYSVDPEAQFFLSWIWLSQLFLRRPDSWCILAAAPGNDAQNYVAFFPLRPTTRFSKSRNEYVNEIYMGGNFWADHTGLICHPDFEQIAIPALAEHLQKMHWAKLHLENFRASDRRIALLTDQFTDRDFRTSYRNRTSKVDGINNLKSPYVKIPGSYDEYLQTRLSANTRQKIRRLQRVIDASDDLRIEASNPATRDKDLDALIEFWTERWSDRKGKKVTTLASKYRKIVEQGLEADIVYMPILREQDRPISMLASFVDREKKSLLYFVAGRDLSWNVLPSGLVLHAHNVRWAIENDIHTYELLRGDEQYKYSLGAKDRLIVCIRIETKSGSNWGSKLAPASFDFVLKDMAHRLRTSDDKLKRKLCKQFLNSWPDEEEALERCQSSTIKEGRDTAAT